MLNFIIYEDKKIMRELYKNVIHEFVGGKQERYHITEVPEFSDETNLLLQQIEGRKIYILDIAVPGMNGLDLARIIRSSGDWKSQIIIISDFEHYKGELVTGKMLTLDFISKRENIPVRLLETLNLAYHISNAHRFFSFQFNGEIFRLPYQDILYFAKDLNDNYTSIVTDYNTYKVKKSILQIEKILEDDLRFFKTHQSCIINLHKVRFVNTSLPKISFGEKETNLLSREHKKELKERLTNS